MDGGGISTREADALELSRGTEAGPRALRADGAWGGGDKVASWEWHVRRPPGSVFDGRLRVSSLMIRLT